MKGEKQIFNISIILIEKMKEEKMQMSFNAPISFNLSTFTVNKPVIQSLSSKPMESNVFGGD